jgi:poly-gamma-glutamate capsule biosynthesis protein CapA/YwtB (metallophosphatase superfamily)
MTNVYPNKPDVRTKYITTYLADVSTAGQIYVAPGFAGKIKKVTTVLNSAISGANAVLTLKIGGTAVTAGTITIAQASSASGDIDTCVPTGANSFTAAQAIEIETNGASSDTAIVTITLELEPI